MKLSNNKVTDAYHKTNHIKLQQSNNDKKTKKKMRQKLHVPCKRNMLSR